MKKAYKKPEIAYDSFELSGSIAAGCEFISNHAYTQCALADGAFGSVFTDNIVACAMTMPDGTDGICYHVPSDDHNLFTS